VGSRKHPVPESWTGAPEFTPESRAITAAFPDLHLRVWCNVRGVNVLAYVDRSDSKGRLVRTDIAKATWRGKPPTEADVVLWGAMVLSTWLEARILALGEAEAAAA
jgi:hypothetical protein